MQLHSVRVPRRGYYHVEESRAESPSGVLIGLHGYAQSSEEFLDELKATPNSEQFHLVAVQGTNVFYNKKRDVRASWMTMWEREEAIEDNLSFTGAVLDKLVARYPTLHFHLFGFSQGGAMAYRLAAARPEVFKRLIVQGSDFPAEVATAKLPALLLLRGDSDSLYSAETLEADEKRLKALGLRYECQQYQGGHHPNEISRSLLSNFLS